MASPVELAARLDGRGRLLALDAASEPLRRRLRVGGTLAPLIDEASAPALLDFLFSLQRHGAGLAFDLELAPAGAGTLHLAGVVAEAGAVLLGVRERPRLLQLARGLADGEVPLAMAAGGLAKGSRAPGSWQPLPEATSFLAGLWQAHEWEDALLAPDLARENAELRRELAATRAALARAEAASAAASPSAPAAGPGPDEQR